MIFFPSGEISSIELINNMLTEIVSSKLRIITQIHIIHQNHADVKVSKVQKFSRPKGLKEYNNLNSGVSESETTLSNRLPISKSQQRAHHLQLQLYKILVVPNIHETTSNVQL